MFSDYTDTPPEALARGWRVARLDEESARVLVWDAEEEWLALVPSDLAGLPPVTAATGDRTFKEVLDDARRERG